LISDLALFLGLGKLPRNHLNQAIVLRQAEDVADVIGLAPRHQRLPRKARIGSQHNAHRSPTLAKLPDYAGDFFHRTRRGIDIRWPQLRRHQLIAQEHIKRQVAVAIVVAVEKAAFLMAVQGIIGRVEIENNLFRRLLVRFDDQIDQQRFDSRRIMRNLVIARRFRPAQLQTVERRLAGYRCTILALGLELAGQHRHHRIMAQLVMVVEILIAQRDPHHPLANQRFHLVLNQFLTAPVAKAPRKPFDQLERPVG
jgi:hypothetical protein